MQLRIVLLAVLALGAALPGFSGPINIGEWYTGSWDGGGPGATIGGCIIACPYVGAVSGETFNDPLNSPWTFVATGGGAVLTVTDIQVDGDSFTIQDFGSSVGSTNPINSVGLDCGTDGADCLGNPGFSHGVFVLAPGAHSLSFIVAAQTNGFSDGSVSFRLDAVPGEVPEPANLGLLALGIAGGLILRRRLAR